MAVRHPRTTLVLLLLLVAALLLPVSPVLGPLAAPADAHATCTVPITKTLRGKSATLDQCYNRTFTRSGTTYRIHVYYTETSTATNTNQCTAAENTANRCEHALSNNDDANGDNVVAVAVAVEVEAAYRFFIGRGLDPVAAGVNEMNVFIGEDPRGGGIPDSNSLNWDDEMIDNNDVLAKRLLAYHEIMHLVQDKNDGTIGWAGFYGEGIARSIEDRVDTALDADTGHLFIPEMQGILGSDAVRTSDLTTNSYTSALWWTWLWDNYVGAGDTAPVESWGAIDRFYDDLNAATTEIGALTTFITGEGGNFNDHFDDYTQAMWAYRFDPPDSSLDFLDTEINTSAGQLSGHSVQTTASNFAAGSAVTMAPRSSRYFERNPASTCDYTAYTFSSTVPMSFSVMVADGGSWVDGWRSTGTSFSRTVRTTGIDRIVGTVTSHASGGNVTVSRGCVTPSIDVVSPTSAAFAIAGTADNPRSILTRVKVTGQDGAPVGGLTAAAFEVGLRKVGTTPVLPATILSAAYVQDEYWILARAPNAAAGAETGQFYDIRVALGTANDINTNSVLYIERAQDVIIVTDRSGSMGDSGKMTAANNAAALLANQLAPQDEGGYVRFDTDAQVRDQLKPMTNTQRNAMIGHISTETPAAATSIGDGLKAAATEHDARKDPAHVCSFVLLSDGFENEPDSFATVRAQVADNGCGIHAIALGPQANEPLMQQIGASVPGGSYSYAQDDGTVTIGQRRADGAADGRVGRSSSQVLPWQSGLTRTYDWASTQIAGRQRTMTDLGDGTTADTCAGPETDVDLNDLVEGTTYTPGDTFQSRGRNFRVDPYLNDGQETTSGEARVVTDGYAHGSGLEMATFNTRYSTVLPAGTCEVTFRYADSGAVNLEVNGEVAEAGEMLRLDGQNIGGGVVSVSQQKGNEFGIVTIRGDLKRFGVGGQELWTDDIRSRLAGGHEIFVDETTSELVVSAAWQTPPPVINRDGRESRATSATITLVKPDGSDAGNVCRVSSDDLNIVCTVLDPDKGTWTAIVRDVGTDYLLTVQAESDVELHAYATPPTDDLVDGVEVPILATFTGTDGPLTDADVVAEVTSPAGTIQSMRLYDDGSHADGEPDDGVYGNTYTATSIPEVTADNPAEGAAPAVVASYLVEVVGQKGDLRREAQTSFALSRDKDDDGDGLPTGWEVRWGFDPTVVNGDQDPDRDGLTNKCEFEIGTNPLNGDTDGGGESDGSEVTQSTPCVVTGKDPFDPDDDGITPLIVTVRPEADKDGPFVIVEWDPVTPESGDPVTYDVWRQCGNGPWELIATVNEGPYIDRDVAPGDTCRYQVIPTDGTVIGDGPIVGPVEVLADPYPPQGDLVIDDGAVTTDDQSVKLTLGIDDGADDGDGQPAGPGASPDLANVEMRLGNEPDLSGAPWQPFSATVADWDLGDAPSGDWASVWVQFREDGGAPGPARFDTILVTEDLRLDGETRIDTGVEVSKESFGDGEAEVVVLSRSDLFADALAGIPLAVRRSGPLLLTPPDSLAKATSDEIKRVLPPGRTVYILGGPVALSPAVEKAIQDLGYETVRLAGETRYDTAIEITGSLGVLETLFVTTGQNFPDALAAGAAAAHLKGGVLLTPSEARLGTVEDFLDDHADATSYAVGGPSARPYPELTPLFGETREETATIVATTLFEAPPTVGMARSDAFPDSLTGGAHAGRHGAPIVLTRTNELGAAASKYLCETDSLYAAFIYGGPVAISEPVAEAIADRVNGTGC